MTAPLHSRWAVALALALGGCGASSSAPVRVNYPNGNPHWEYEQHDGLPNGTGRVWHENGALRSEGPYLNGDKEGVFRYFDDTGAFDHQAAFVAGIERWRSDDPHAEPPADVGRELAAAESKERARQDRWARWGVSHDPRPSPYFSLLDRAAALSRAGAAIGVGDVRRAEIFANYAFDRYGVYGQFLETDLRPDTPMSASGKQTIEVGATRRVHFDALGTLVARAGVLVPVGNDDLNGFVGSSADAAVDPSDVAVSFPSSFAVRTSASLTRRRRYVVLEGDAGVDWIMDGQRAPLEAVLRANAGVGVGVRAGVVSFEIANAVLASDLSRRLTSVGVAGTGWIAGFWLTVSATESLDDQGQLSIGFGHEL